MSSKPLVNILMPVFNEEKHLESCLQSIINQDFTKWKLIAINDFSTDKSGQILHRFASSDKRIVVIQNKFKGIIPALALAFQNTNADMVTRMDADDIMPKNKLRILWENLCQLGPGHVVSGKVKYFSDDGLGEGFLKYEQWINQQNFYTDIYRECTLPSACWMAYKDDLLQIKAFENLSYPEDYDLLFKLYKAGIQVMGIDEILHYWRDHPYRASRTDPNYRDQNFFDLKVKYFMEIDRDKKVPLVIWGTGKRGKSLIKKLQTMNDSSEWSHSLNWVTTNAKKIGHNIYGIEIKHAKWIKKLEKKQVIIVISDTSFLAQKQEIYRRLNLDSSEIFEFC